MADIRLDRRFSKTVRARYESYEFDVGVLQDGPHKSALSSARGLKSVAGGPARKTGRSSYQSIAAVSESLREKTGINFYTEPFRAKKNQDILKFTRAFLSHAGGKPRLNQVKNLLQAIVRNPITRGDYGQNSEVTARIKGFNRLMIDTGQLFKAITSKVRMKRV